MSVPSVVIVGRPNVGKSSLVNWLAGKLVSVVDPTAGVTRDRVTYLMHEQGRHFELVDTGGMGVEDADDLTADIERQIDAAIADADLVLFVVDGRTGVTPLDRHVAERLRGVAAPKLLVVNKCDSTRLDDEIAEFYALIGSGSGLGETRGADRRRNEEERAAATDAGPSAPPDVVLTSVKAKRNRGELLRAILDHLPPAANDEAATGESLAQEPELKLAIVGRRNVGKSTFINALAETERMIVSDVPGTTRDSVDIRFDLDGKAFVAIDTPGVRKRKSLANDIEYYGLVRAKRSIRRADVVLMFFDAESTISRVDKQLVDEIESHWKPCVFVVNKWDLGKSAEMTMEKWSEYLIHNFPGMRHAPMAFVTAKSGRNVKKLINLAQAIAKQARVRVSTGELNRIVRAAVKANPPRYKKNRRPKIFFATQVSTEPPTLVLKCNDPERFDEHWKRYLLGVLREELPFREVPIKVHFRGRENAAEPDGDVDNVSALPHFSGAGAETSGDA
ncbi:MAG: ribosome-associated GTPase EngA [Planctomycetaceae bacterium]|nr:ribosome-associated GTPase EngA [Planctomycetaceae bacterium]